jgi:hypothetical protein
VDEWTWSLLDDEVVILAERKMNMDRVDTAEIIEEKKQDFPFAKSAAEGCRSGLF